jgi:sirohydrochlorin ferrochelatase
MALAFLFAWSTIVLASESKTGFLVIAQDRGFVGNQEVQTLMQEFKKEYPAALGLIGREYTGVEGEYAVYLTRAVQELKKAGATEIVAIPLFLSAEDPILRRAMPTLPAYAAGLPLRWAPVMAESYLTSQVVLDRVDALSQQPEQERLLLVGIGATDEASEKALKTDADKLLAYVQRYTHFREAETVIYYDRAVEGAEKKNDEIKAHILAQIAKQGRTIVVPTFIGPKFDRSMAMTAWLGKQFKGLNVAYHGAELLPHPNILLWLKKTANQFVAARPEEIGVVIMPHGSTQPWNDAAERTIEPLKTKYKIEMAYGMGDHGTIQDAVNRLEKQGVKRIVFVRMYELERQMKPLTDYILGLADSPTPPGHTGGHGHDAAFPPQIRSAVLFSTFGGYTENFSPIASVLCDRIVEVSKDPAKETVVLLAHGSSTDEDNNHWLSVIRANIEWVKKDPRCAPFKPIKAATVREDWPEKREKAVADVRKMIEDDAKTGRVLVIANRMYGSGPYKKMLKGLDYVLNEKGFASPVITRWLEEGITKIATALAQPMVRSQQVAQQ